jgi:hypothetical protein
MNTFNQAFGQHLFLLTPGVVLAGQGPCRLAGPGRVRLGVSSRPAAQALARKRPVALSGPTPRRVRRREGGRRENQGNQNIQGIFGVAAAPGQAAREIPVRRGPGAASPRPPEAFARGRGSRRMSAARGRAAGKPAKSKYTERDRCTNPAAVSIHTCSEQKMRSVFILRVITRSRKCAAFSYSELCATRRRHRLFTTDAGRENTTFHAPVTLFRLPWFSPGGRRRDRDQGKNAASALPPLLDLGGKGRE